jgi:hypothetical protein
MKVSFKMSRILWALAGILAFSQSGVSQQEFPQSEFSSAHFGTPTTGPFGVPNDEFVRLLSGDINATGVYPLSGPNITDPDASTSAVDGWSWKIAVKADIPLTESATDYSIDKNTSYFTGSMITLEAPSSVVASYWDVCVIRWNFQSGYTDQLRQHSNQDDGTCSSVLNDSCRSDMSKAISSTWKNNTGNGRCQCPELKTISSCGTPPLSFTQGCTASCKYQPPQYPSVILDCGKPC